MDSLVVFNKSKTSKKHQGKKANYSSKIRFSKVEVPAGNKGANPPNAHVSLPLILRPFSWPKLRGQGQEWHWDRFFGPLNSQEPTRWAPISYKWSYGAPINGLINGQLGYFTLLIGVITPFITGMRPILYPLGFTNIAGWNLPIFNRKYIFPQSGAPIFQVSAMLVDPGVEVFSMLPKYP